MSAARHRAPRPTVGRRPVWVTALVTAALLVGAGGATAGTSFTRHNDTQGTMRVSGAPIRVGTSGSYVHTNSTHAALNITSIKYDGLDLVVYRATQRGDRVVACIAEEDETLSRLDIQVGCSGGGYMSRLSFYRDGKKINPKTIKSSTANVWLQITSYVPGPR